MTGNQDIQIMTAGPSQVPDWVLEAMQRPVIHQRTPAFEAFFNNLQDGLRYFFQTESRVLAFPGTGTHGVEMALFSLFGPEDKLLLVNFGKFSARWVQFGQQGMTVHSLDAEWGAAISVDQLREALMQYPGLSGVVFTHCETSTGVAIDLEEMAYAVSALQPEALIVVDAVSSAGAMPLYMDAWQLDVVVGASQKALMNPAGTALVCLSDRAADRISASHPWQESAFHLFPYLRAANEGSYPYTPPTQLWYGLVAALDHFQTTGLPWYWNRVHHCARQFRAELEAAGAKLWGASNADALTAFQVPGLEADRVRARLKESFGIELSGGQGQLKGQILRLGHFGMHGIEAHARCTDALKVVIAELKKAAE